ncbi:MAG: hypothetical protein ACD_58C00132G0008 [uncultured bacterium]|nr:MAG: hypothetical protein ACD_58C00132G0008 [uncultured bacterium]
MEDGLYNDLTYQIIGVSMKVHTTLGPGFTENIYQKALEKELFDNKLDFFTQKVHKVIYKNIEVGTYRSDLFIANKIIVELKAVAELDLHLAGAQLISYLAATKSKVGLIFNFGQRKLEYKRIILPKKLQ